MQGPAAASSSSARRTRSLRARARPPTRPRRPRSCTSRAASPRSSAPDGIRVNTVNPDAVLEGSRIWDSAWREERARAYGIEPEELEAHYRARTTLKVNVVPADIAEAVLFLASPDSVGEEHRERAQRGRRRGGRLPALVRIALFVTCFSDTLFPEARRRCRRARAPRPRGRVPRRQTCCGQLHFNSGYRDEAVRLARRFATVFADSTTSSSPSSSCVGIVREFYVRSCRRRVFELSELLVDKARRRGRRRVLPAPRHLPPDVPLAARAQVGDAPLRLLRNVRGLELVELPDADECCGFGGTFAVKNAEHVGGDAGRQVPRRDGERAPRSVRPSTARA